MVLWPLVNGEPPLLISPWFYGLWSMDNPPLTRPWVYGEKERPSPVIRDTAAISA